MNPPPAKPLKGRNYGSIPHLSSSKIGQHDYFLPDGQQQLLTLAARPEDTVLVFEKYDGSNVGIAKINGQIHALIRAGYLAKDSIFIQHHYFARWVELHKNLFAHLLQDGQRLVGEWLAQAHGLQYKIHGHPIVFFDLFLNKDRRAPYAQLAQLLATTDFLTPRLLHSGPAIAPERLLPILHQKTPEFQSLEAPEGMVYRLERRQRVDFLAKWVRPDFKVGQYCDGIPDEQLIWNIDISPYAGS